MRSLANPHPLTLNGAALLPAPLTFNGRSQATRTSYLLWPVIAIMTHLAVRLGRGRAKTSAGTSARTRQQPVPEQCQNQCQHSARASVSTVPGTVPEQCQEQCQNQYIYGARTVEV